MALIVEDGTIVPNADSYVSVAFSDTYHSSRGNLDWKDESASVILRLSTNPSDGDTLTIDSKIYTFEDNLTDVDGHIQIGASVIETQSNFVAALELSGTPGVHYAASTTAHTTCRAAEFVGEESIVYAIVGGSAGNAIIVDDALVSVLDGFLASTLTGGKDTREISLRLAAQHLEGRFRNRWPGNRQSSSQSLSWPRWNAKDNDGFYVDSNVVPDAVKRAQCILAEQIRIQNPFIQVEQPGIKKESIKVGSLSRSVEYVSAQPSVRDYPEVILELRGLIIPANTIERG